MLYQHHYFLSILLIWVSVGTASALSHNLHFFKVCFDKTGSFEITDRLTSKALATAYFEDVLNEHGYLKFSIRTESRVSDELQLYAAGILEGYLLAPYIYEYYEQIRPFFNESYRVQIVEAIQKIRYKSSELGIRDPFYHQIRLLLQQLDGIRFGLLQYNEEKDIDFNIDFAEIYMLQLYSFPGFSDSYDLSSEFFVTFNERFTEFQALFLIKDHSSHKHLFVLKTYEFSLKKQKNPSMASLRLFLSRPGVIFSPEGMAIDTNHVSLMACLNKGCVKSSRNFTDFLVLMAQSRLQHYTDIKLPGVALTLKSDRIYHLGEGLQQKLVGQRINLHGYNCTIETRHVLDVTDFDHVDLMLNRLPSDLALFFSSKDVRKQCTLVRNADISFSPGSKEYMAFPKGTDWLKICPPVHLTSRSLKKNSNVALMTFFIPILVLLFLTCICSLNGTLQPEVPAKSIFSDDFTLSSTDDFDFD
ncbi:hypothetical protein PCE1_002492 [Barthelona sp. PCE]